MIEMHIVVVLLSERVYVMLSQWEIVNMHDQLYYPSFFLPLTTKAPLHYLINVVVCRLTGARHGC